MYIHVKIYLEVGSGTVFFFKEISGGCRLNGWKVYFFSRLVWLATHCQRPSVNTQVSVKRPKCS